MKHVAGIGVRGGICDSRASCSSNCQTVRKRSSAECRLLAFFVGPLDGYACKESNGPIPGRVCQTIRAWLARACAVLGRRIHSSRRSRSSTRYHLGVLSIFRSESPPLPAGRRRAQLFNGLTTHDARREGNIPSITNGANANRRIGADLATTMFGGLAEPKLGRSQALGSNGTVRFYLDERVTCRNAGDARNGSHRRNEYC